MKQIELNERGEDVTDYNRGYREGYDAARVRRTKYQLVINPYKFK